MISSDLRNSRSATNDGGFAYVGVLFLVAIGTLVSSIAIEVSETKYRREQERELLSIGRQFKRALASYVAASPVSGPDAYPREIEDLLNDQRVYPPRRHLRKLFFDPMTGKDEWNIVKNSGHIIGFSSKSEKIAILNMDVQVYGAGFTAGTAYNDIIFSYP